LASPAQAGCPNLCDVTTPLPVITPELDCGTLKTTVNDCDCGLQVVLVNSCPNDSIIAVDFEFAWCSNAPPSHASCSEVLPRSNASSVFPLSTQGETRKTLTLRDASGDHSVELSATVSAFHDGCAVCASGPRGKPLGALAVVAFAALALARRRWKACELRR